MIETVHTALVLRGERGAIIDIIELEPGERIAMPALRDLMRRHGAREIERVTTIERRAP
ncbi:MULTISPECIES: hypothetical protein [unclassified Bradyrhizobium]|uniref:hypothetical protein n=1 Tax=unclassified Bradyrhizobium TaxID=2631580 RepID=UPI002916D8AE|nr:MULTISPECIES: hypothetical protein [unclassified Bradyrhizobium]